jgi:hypothetical protein
MVRSDTSEVQVKAASGSQAAEVTSFGEAEYFDVPFEDNGLAKAFGLKWDSRVRKWFAPSADVAVKYRDALKQSPLAEKSSIRIYFNVHYLQKDRAKELGMLFDRNQKKWFAPTTEIAALGSSLFTQLGETE